VTRGRGAHTVGVWTPLTSFIGRAAAAAELTRLLDGCRLVTVTGPGGVGKTRLAAEVARRIADQFPDGAWFIELGAIAAAADVPAEVMSALDIPQDPGKPALEGIAEALASRRLLLVLDNCEHVLPAVAELCAILLDRADDVHVLATSREQLGISGETGYRLAPLDLPSPAGSTPATVRCSAAETLFIERARQADPRFAFRPEDAPLVSQVVTRLDGMPLAIELAAARVEALGLSGLADRIDDALRLLAGRGTVTADRHRSLVTVADWSYRLLTGQEQRVFRRLSVFPGAFTLEAAESVAGPDAGPTVVRLVDCSLLVPPRTGADQRTRYSMLETLRAYGRDRLREAGEEHQAAAALAAYAKSVAEQAAAGLATSNSERPALQWLDAEDATLSWALTWALDHDPDDALRLVTALVPWLRTRGRIAEARDWLRRGLARSSPANQSCAQAKLFLEYLSSGSADRAGGGGLYTEVIEAHRDGAASHELMEALIGRAVHWLNLGNDPAVALPDALRALAVARETGDAGGELLALAGLSFIASYAGDAASALSWARQAEELVPLDTAAHEKRWCLRVIAIVLSEIGELAAARRVCTAGITLSRRANDVTYLLSSLTAMANIERWAGNVREARTHLCEAAGLAARNGDHVNLMNLVNECGYLCAETGRWADAATLWAANIADRNRRGLAIPQGDEIDRAKYLPRLELALEPGQLRAAQERGAGMTAAAAAELAIMTTASAPGKARAPGNLLSSRERELVILVAQGHTNAQIAERLHISVRTVASHLDRIRDKTGHRRRADLTRLALEESLV
jgi:predicted ATPase/DNA-binding CsgD family transcriptional regulator